MNFFSNLHPFVLLFYFLELALVMMVFFDPVLYAVLFVSLLCFTLYTKGKREGGRLIFFCLTLSVLCVGINTLVNHRGTTVVASMGEGGLPITLESMVYGGIAGGLVSCSLLLFACFHAIMTSEKIMCLFGNILPGFSLIFSMVLRLVPKCRRDYQKIQETHKRERGVLSALVGIALEDSLETGVMMRYRWYGTGKRTSIYRRAWCARDVWFLIGTALCGIGGTVLYVASGTGMDVFPYIELHVGRAGMFAYGIFFILANVPMILNGKEEIKWRHLISNI